MSLEEPDLALVDEQGQLACFREVRLRREQGEALEARVAVARHRGRRDGEQCATEAIARGMDAAFRDQLPKPRRAPPSHRAGDSPPCQGRRPASRILPGNHEHRIALRDEIADKRVLRRQIEDIIFHDPGRHDQDRLRPHVRRRRRILNELDQAIAKDDLARRDRDVASNLRTLRRRLAFRPSPAVASPPRN